jgi:hypothetical protein
VALASQGIGGRRYTSEGFRCVPQEVLDSGHRPYVCTEIEEPSDGPRPTITFLTLGNG